MNCLEIGRCGLQIGKCKVGVLFLKVVTMRCRIRRLCVLWVWRLVNTLGSQGQVLQGNEKPLLSTIFFDRLLRAGLLSQAKTVGFVFCTFCPIVIIPGVSYADAWVITPSARLEQRYDDNIRLSTDSPDAVWATELSGAAELSRQTDTTEIGARLRLDFITYNGVDEDEDALRDELNPFVNVSSLYRTERSEWRLDGDYRRDSTLRTLRDIGPTEELPETDTDINLVRERIRRNQITLNPSWTYSFTERTGSRLGYRYTQVFYEDAEDTGLLDYSLHVFTGEIFHGLTEKDQISAVAETTLYDADADREFQSYALLGGLNHAFSETTRAGILIGLRQSSFENPTEEGDDTGFVVRLEGTRKTELATFSARFEQSLSPSGTGGGINSDRFTFQMTRKILPRLDFSLQTQFFSNESIEDDNTSADRDYFEIEPRLNWNLTRWWSIATSYRYRRQERDSDPDSAESNAVFLSLNYSRATQLGD